MKPRRLEFWAALLTPLICLAVSILDFSGLLEHVEWLSSRIPSMTLLAVGAVGFTITIDRQQTLTRLKLLLGERNRELIEQVQSANLDVKAVEIIHGLWKEREPEIEYLLNHIESDPKINDHPTLVRWLREETKRLVDGKLSHSELRFPWDFTLAAISLDGTFIYHPTPSNISTRRRDYPYQRMLDERQGTFVWYNERKSEQVNALVSDRSFSCHRLSKVHFRYFARVEAIVIFESHITLLNQVPKGAFKEHV